MGTSQYKGVHWHNKKWYVHFYFTRGKQKYGGTFKNELDAAKRVNQLCEEMKILPKKSWNHRDAKSTIANQTTKSISIQRSDLEQKKRYMACSSALKGRK